MVPNQEISLPPPTPSDAGLPKAVSSPAWGIRAAVAAVALAGWFWTQALIGKRAAISGGIVDRLHLLSEPLHQFLLDHPRSADGLLVVSSAFIDLFGIFLLVWGIFGPSVRPLLGLVLLFGLRQLCQWVCALPPPEGMIWHHPGFPSLLVTYGVSSDLFFSGHTAVAVLGAIEVGRLGSRWLALAAAVLALFEASTVLVLRAHYTLDVFAGAVTALYVAYNSDRLGPLCDRAMARWVSWALRQGAKKGKGTPPPPSAVPQRGGEPLR